MKRELVDAIERQLEAEVADLKRRTYAELVALQGDRNAELELVGRNVTRVMSVTSLEGERLRVLVIIFVRQPLGMTTSYMDGFRIDPEGSVHPLEETDFWI